MNTIKLKDANSEPVPELIQDIEEVLDLAKSGKLRNIAIIGDLIGNRSYTSFSCMDMQKQIGALSYLQHTLCAKMRESGEPR